MVKERVRLRADSSTRRKLPGLLLLLLRRLRAEVGVESADVAEVGVESAEPLPALDRGVVRL